MPITFVHYFTFSLHPCVMFPFCLCPCSYGMHPPSVTRGGSMECCFAGLIESQLLKMNHHPRRRPLLLSSLPATCVSVSCTPHCLPYIVFSMLSVNFPTEISQCRFVKGIFSKETTYDAVHLRKVNIVLP